MGCVSSTFLHQEDDFPQIGNSSLSHHIVSLTSTTYGLLTLDPPRFNPTPISEPRSLKSDPEVINSWELMAGLDNDSFRFSPLPLLPKTKSKQNFHEFHKLCPPDGETKLVIYTTTLRGVRQTFDACNAVRSAFQTLGVLFCERDISMDRGFRDELKQLMKPKHLTQSLPPRVFLRGRYLGGSEEVLRIHEQGCLAELLHGLPKAKMGHICDGCGGATFLPCFHCNGSCKIVKPDSGKKTFFVRCSDCNENGLVLCPICS